MRTASHLALFRHVATVFLCSICAFSPVSQAASAEDEVRATFDRFVEVQNRHDVQALEAILLDSPKFLWITRGNAIWGSQAALKRFGTLYEGTWRLEPDIAALRIVVLTDDVAQVHVPITFSTGAAGQAPQSTRMFINQVLVKREGRWRVASIFPVPAPAP